MEKAIVEARDLHKTYQMGDMQVHALRGVTFEIVEGSLTLRMFRSE